MSERPILFSRPMVQALLDDAKTQTRRIVKPQPATQNPSISCNHLGEWYGWMREGMGRTSIRNPYGKPGDHLWVKETFHYDNSEYVNQYKACPFLGLPDRDNAETYYHASENNPDIFPRWKPSIFMPRWASRITLEIVDVEVERLNAISERDAMAEGAHRKIWITSPMSAGAMNARGERGTYRDGYKDIWESINGAGSWALNPWVWKITFKKV